MKSKLSLFLIGVLFLLLLLSGCGGNETAAVDIGAEPAESIVPQEAQLPKVTPQPRMGAEPSPPQAAEEATPAPGEEAGMVDLTREGEEYGASPKAEVIATVAHAFAAQEGLVTLYGAAEYTNAGDCPIIVPEVTFTFSYGGGIKEHTFSPALYEYDILLPGETGFITLYLEGIEGVDPGSNVSLSASLKAEKTLSSRVAMEVQDVYLADNYPGFTTMTGTLSLLTDTECGLNMAYVGFYDEKRTLLGVWNFTKSALFEGMGDAKNFTIHMRALPIEGLAEKTASTKATAFGFR